VVASLVLLTEHGLWLVVFATAIAGVTSMIRLRSAPATMAVQLAGIAVAIAVFATDHAFHLDAPGRVLLALATAAASAGAVACSTHGGDLAVAAPLLVTTGGLFLCLPDTEPPLLLAGVLVPVIALLVIGPVTSASASVSAASGDGRLELAPVALALVFVSLPINGSVGGPVPAEQLPAIAIGGIACAGVLLAWPVARVLVWASPGRPRVPWIALAGLQVPAVIVLARLGVVRQTVERCIAVSAGVLVVLVGMLAAGEVAARLRAGRARSTDGVAITSSEPARPPP
jgi:hypothetical protein